MNAPLRILVHGLNFSPDMVGIAKYTSEMARALADRGHAVRVVTAPPYYPAWRIGAGYKAFRYVRDTDGDFPVLRCPLWVPARLSGWRRILHLASFALSSLPAVVAEAWRFRPDVVWSVQPALMAAPASLLAARLTGAKSWMHIQDFEIDAAFSLGIIKAPLLRRVALAFERAILRRFDRLSTISPKMVALLDRKGFGPDRASLFPNWVDCRTIRPLTEPSPLRRALSIPDDCVVALYAGSLGYKQGLSIILDAAHRLAGRPNLLFLLCGEGSARKALEAEAAGLGNVRFLPLQPLGRLNALLNAADIHLLPQLGLTSDLVLPSKLAGQMASGRPVVATAHDGTSLAAAVAPCGLVVPPEDGPAFAAAIAALAGDPGRRQRLGRAGRQKAQREWDKERLLADFEAALYRLVGHDRRETTDDAA